MRTHTGVGRLYAPFVVMTYGATLLLGQSKPQTPKLEPAFDIHLQVGDRVDIGKTPMGLRRFAAVNGGTIEGPGIKGKILPGTDYQIIHDDGMVEIDGHYAVQMENGDHLYLINRGVRHAPPEILKRLNAGEKVDPSLIYFRTIISIETAAPSLQWMTRTILIGMGERFPTEAVVHVYKLD